MLYNNDNFSFLKNERFRRWWLANNFQWTLFREDWEQIEKNLWASDIDFTQIERVRYLPQNYFNNLTDGIESEEFNNTLESVIFNHLDDSLKLWKSSFNELKNLKHNLLIHK